MAGAAAFGHALAGLAFLALAGWQLARPGGGAARLASMVAFAAVATWAAAAVGVGGQALFARFAESGRNVALLGMLFAMAREAQPALARRGSPLLPVYAAVLGVLLVQTGLFVLPAATQAPEVIAAFATASRLLRMAAACGALILIHNLATSPGARRTGGPALAGMAALWAYDLNLYTVSVLNDAPAVALIALRGWTTAAIAPLFAISILRNQGVAVAPSRAMAFRSLSLVAIAAYLAGMVIAARALRLVGSDLVELAQVGVAAGMLLAAALLMMSGRLRAAAKVMIAKHLFRHRYDYRAEWLRFSGTLGTPGSAPLDERLVKALADITESPGGLLLVAAADGGLNPAARWQWPTIDPPFHAAGPALPAHLAATGRILELDPLRASASAERALVPDWMLDAPSAWAAVPLVHGERLVGLVLLARPALDRRLDWEDFDLLRAAGRQVASHLAEARAAEALSDARRFDEFNRRFAFVVHDIKNLVSQLGLVARNAERHADNPAFRADMIETLNDSAAKMTAMLARLSRHDRAPAEPPRGVRLGEIAAAVAGAKRLRHPVRVSGEQAAWGCADPARLEQALGHLVQNAIEASPARVPVTIRIARRGGEVAIEIADQGAGMTAEFVRTRLFQPFASTKDGGFGVGAHEARALVEAMGGRLEVDSREGEGTRFAVVLPAAAALKEVA